MRTSVVFALAVGVVTGSLGTAGVLYAQSKGKDRDAAPVQPAPLAPAPAGLPVDVVTAPFDIVDTPGSTYLLNRTTGQVWRLSFTDVQGNKYWYGMHVPTQQPGTFEEFQARVRRELGAQK